MKITHDILFMCYKTCEIDYPAFTSSACLSPSDTFTFGNTIKADDDSNPEIQYDIWQVSKKKYKRNQISFLQYMKPFIDDSYVELMESLHTKLFIVRYKCLASKLVFFNWTPKPEIDHWAFSVDLNKSEGDYREVRMSKGGLVDLLMEYRLFKYKNPDIKFNMTIEVIENEQRSFEKDQI